MIKTKKQGLLIIISGPSGTGKGTICKNLLKTENIWLSVSTTTREKRLLEKEGIDYFFVSKEDFIQKIEKDVFLEYAVVHNNNYYGTSKKDVQEHLDDGDDVILEIDIEGAIKVKDKIKEAICIFILPPSMKELGKRLIERNTETKEKVIERFKKAYKEINEITKYNYVVVNDEIDKATAKIKAIIDAEKCRVDRIEEVLLNSEEEDMHELLMDNKIFINEKIEL